MRKICLAIVFAILLLASVQLQVAKAEPPKWTVAVYMDSDNNLEPWAQEDIDEMKMVGSTIDVNVIVLWDKYAGPANVYRVIANGMEELVAPGLSGLEVNMGDPATLKAFVKYAKQEFPADKFALMCWDHGDDFRGLLYDEHIPESGFDLMTHQEIVHALQASDVGRIDVLMYGACVMQMIEVSYEYCDSGMNVGYFVANEGYDPLSGLPFDTVLSSLVAQPNMSPLDFSRMIVDEYIAYYDDSAGKGQSQAVTLSVVDVSKVGPLVSALKTMTYAMMDDMAGYKGIVSKARAKANLPWSESGWEKLIDLKMFVQTIHDESLKPNLVQRIRPSVVASVISSSGSVLTSLSDTIVYQRNTHVMDKAGCYGIGIYFPASRASFENNDHIYGSLYENMKFTREGWMYFLNAYWKY